MSLLALTSYEQDALAEFASLSKSIKYRIDTTGNYPEPAELEKFIGIIERFDRIRWDDVYDRLHRSGSNA